MAKKKFGLASIALGSSGAKWIFQNLLFVFFLCFLGITYIANAHYAERKVREIQSLQKEVKQLRWEYMALKSEVMYNYKLSEVAKKVDNQGLRLRKPKKIVAED